MSASIEDPKGKGDPDGSLNDSLAKMSVSQPETSPDAYSESVIPLEELYKLCMKYYKGKYQIKPSVKKRRKKIFEIKKFSVCEFSFLPLHFI